MYVGSCAFASVNDVRLEEYDYCITEGPILISINEGTPS